MKKIIKTIILLTILIFITLPIKSTKGLTVTNFVEIAGNTVESVQIDSQVYGVAATILNWLWAISIFVAIIVLMIIGIKYITGGVQEKTDYKKALIPFLVGALLVVFATTIVKILFKINT